MSTVYDILNSQTQQNQQTYIPTQNNNNFISQLKSFASALKGNPEEIVRGLISSGRMSQAQFDQFGQQASQMMQTMNIR